ncbi:hypothetical protein [Sphingobium xenophagum]
MSRLKRFAVIRICSIEPPESMAGVIRKTGRPAIISMLARDSA